MGAGTKDPWKRRKGTARAPEEGPREEQAESSASDGSERSDLFVELTDLPREVTLLCEPMGIRLLSMQPQDGPASQAHAGSWIQIDLGHAAGAGDAAIRLAIAAAISSQMKTLPAKVSTDSDPGLLVELTIDGGRSDADWSSLESLARRGFGKVAVIHIDNVGKLSVSIGPRKRDIPRKLHRPHPGDVGQATEREIERRALRGAPAARAQYTSLFGPASQNLLKALILAGAAETFRLTEKGGTGRALGAGPAPSLGEHAFRARPRSLSELAALAGTTQSSASKLLAALAERRLLNLGGARRVSLSAPLIGLRTLLEEWLRHEASRDIHPDGGVSFFRVAGEPPSERSMTLSITRADEIINKVTNPSDVFPSTIPRQTAGVLLGGTEGLARGLEIRHASVATLVFHTTNLGQIRALISALSLVPCTREQASMAVSLENSMRLGLTLARVAGSTVAPKEILAIATADPIELYLDTRHSPRGEEIREVLFERIFEPLCETRGWTP